MLRYRTHRGFTLFELLVTVTIAGILAAIAVPNYRSFIAGQRVKTAAQSLFFSMNLARSEAIKRNDDVTVSDANTGAWANGWEVDHSGTAIRKHGPLRNISINTKDSSGNAVATVTYGRDGRLTNTPMPCFAIDDTDKLAQAQILTIDLSGAPEMSAGGTCP